MFPGVVNIQTIVVVQRLQKSFYYIPTIVEPQFSQKRIRPRVKNSLDI